VAYAPLVTTEAEVGTRVDALLVEIEPAHEEPPEIFAAAMRVFLDCRRLDMRALAGSLGISRATLYRKTGSRDQLLGEVLWSLTRRAIEGSLRSADDLDGVDRIVAVVERYIAFIEQQPAFRRLLTGEPEIALRVLTSKHGVVQGRIAAALRALLDQEQRAGALRFTMETETLAYVIVRVCEGFLYADVIADNPPEFAQMGPAVRALVAGASAAV
jgi:AcrR family transcriptional regulator